MKLYFVFTLFMLLCLAPATARGQQPFTTDDADVTERRKFHFQFGNEYDILARAAYPSLRQNTAVFELDYGLLRNVEIGVDAPLLFISNSRIATPRSFSGFGDLDVHVKYNFLKERENSSLPAMTVSLSAEFPTGDTRKQLGSGLTDYFINGVMQKSLTKRTTVRLNGGLLFAGNSATGEIGIRARGRIYTGGGSIVRQFTDKLDLGAEITGAVSGNFQVSSGQLQTLVGGNYLLRKNMTFDFGIIGGKFAGSPRAGVQLGVSVDF